jgi:hypothetical protein
MNRTELLNLLINKQNYNYFLEIGVHKGGNFDNIKARPKLGVNSLLSGYPLSVSERVRKNFTINRVSRMPGAVQPTV